MLLTQQSIIDEEIALKMFTVWTSKDLGAF